MSYASCGTIEENPATKKHHKEMQSLSQFEGVKGIHDYSYTKVIQMNLL